MTWAKHSRFFSQNLRACQRSIPPSTFIKDDSGIPPFLQELRDSFVRQFGNGDGDLTEAWFRARDKALEEMRVRPHQLREIVLAELHAHLRPPRRNYRNIANPRNRAASESAETFRLRRWFRQAHMHRLVRYGRR